MRLNNILRSILNVKSNHNNIPLMSVNQMYKELNLLKFEDIYRLCLLKFAHLVLFNDFNLFQKYFSQYLPAQTYPTRNNRINLPQVRLDVERNSTIFQLCKLLKEIDDEFLMPQSQNVLKRKFKQFCLDHY